MSVFDGMAGLLNDVFGSPVLLTDGQTQASITVQAVFREEPIEVAGETGGLILIEQPTLQVPRILAPDLRRGDLVTLADTRVFRVESRLPSRSPASDKFIICTLEAVL